MRGDRGSATVLVVAHLGVLMVLGVALTSVAGLFHQHRVAQGAADLAALAGAQSVARGAGGCAQAAGIAQANRAELVACKVDGRDVAVTVRTSPPTWPPGLPDLSADARAGPR